MKKPVEYKVATFTDFGEPGRREELGKHKTIATAMRQYARIWEIYGRGLKHDARTGLLVQPKVWQEMIINKRGM